MKSFFIFIVTCLFFVSCEKEESLLISQDQKNIEIIENIARSKGFDVIANKAKGIRTTPLTEEEIEKFNKYYSNLLLYPNLTSKAKVNISPFKNDYINFLQYTSQFRGNEITHKYTASIPYKDYNVNVEIMWGTDESNNEIVWAGASVDQTGPVLDGGAYAMISPYSQCLIYDNHTIDIEMYVNIYRKYNYVCPIECPDFIVNNFDHSEHFSIIGSFYTEGSTTLEANYVGEGICPPVFH